MEVMVLPRASLGFVAIALLLFAIAFPAVMAQSTASPLASAPLPSNGTSIDQGVACVLMLVALVLTYLIH